MKPIYLILLAIVLIIFICTLLRIRQVKNISFWKNNKRIRRIHKNLLVMMDTLHTTFRDHNITYWIHSGTLLGAIRHSGFIPWDDDIDIVILEQDVEKVKNIPFAQHKIITHPFGFLQLYDKSAKLNDNFFTGEEEHIDLYFYKLEGNRYTGTKRAMEIWPHEYYLVDELFPLKQYQFEGRLLNGPNKDVEIVKRFYGPKCLTEAKLFNIHCIDKFTQILLAIFKNTNVFKIKINR